ncbi:MAG: UDP-N-acetylmuramoyl-L-alanyl-D-glutamate--2,6-diaminopimelate ligase [Melioribacteraceae bacterium]|nr:UDP-N-acetylmuramoyl-L-alanyl-D-glutamate--2,6-diaminopimelate ligase [Melioribacteraceae bacterium]MCF8354519.1 UDP-N-acetylmuramoyl-L-alanyl-D-glutamate--2,6-diaminopimelate ligase [Melioribacteraceae bacterium]MCF8394288.1 UDP-N-acetylmuramoyl-L-alanyl-D-glutamate--2,6-diaminopimelate ligase [Melioribacteraceae bacterium]MCF8418188.1 UDP-N-acetylmuramoyl-L-alanyl-D-glutamate--2,6-diaminopimelate ligase [Melioribacteraceae bacterium]
MNLAELLNSVDVIQVTGNAELKEIRSLTFDSREAGNGSLFFAVRGFKTDGHKFIPEVLSKNPAAIVIDNPESVPAQIFDKSECVKIIVEDSRKAMAQFANIFYGEPSKKLKVFGITGTKGKTTSVFYLKHILQNAGIKTGLIGTIKNMIGDKTIATKLTTPESITINDLMHQMITEGCTHCVMEISSHSLSLHRIDYLDIDYAGFTNITSDHMDYHKTFENYLDSKKTLFDQLKPDSCAVVNCDDPSWEKLTANSKSQIKTYGEDRNAQFKIKNIEYDFESTSYDLEFDGNEYKIKTSLVGKFNVHNSAVAFALAYESGIDAEIIIKGIETAPQVPGRFEIITRGTKKVVIDYAHSSDSLKKVLLSMNHVNKEHRPLYTVFGCGGDRDKTKRPVMGSIAEELSDYVYVTSDNPRTEDPVFIIEDIKKGLKKDNHKIVVDREEAIKKSIMESEDNAVILIAGKGHENYQEINGVRNYFSDKDLAEKYLGMIN